MIQNIISGKEAELMMKKVGVVAMDISDRFIDIYLKDSSSIDVIPITTFELQYVHTIYLPTDILPDKYSRLK